MPRMASGGPSLTLAHVEALTIRIACAVEGRCRTADRAAGLSVESMLGVGGDNGEQMEAFDERQR